MHFGEIHPLYCSLLEPVLSISSFCITASVFAPAFQYTHVANTMERTRKMYILRYNVKSTPANRGPLMKWQSINILFNSFLWIYNSPFASSSGSLQPSCRQLFFLCLRSEYVEILKDDSWDAEMGPVQLFLLFTKLSTELYSSHLDIILQFQIDLTFYLVT